MQYKELSSFLKDFKEKKGKGPRFLLLSGQDMELGELIIRDIKKHLQNELGSYELLVFSHESQESMRLHSELANAPLFSLYRFILVRKAEEILKEVFSSTARAKAFSETLKKTPARTLILFLYAGAPKVQILKLLESQDFFMHFVSAKIYADQLEGVLKRALQQRKWKLAPEAFHFLLENIDSKTGSIEHVLDALELFAKEREEVSMEEVRSVLFPDRGWDPFILLDALFSGDRKQLLSQYKRFHPGIDNFFVLLKLLLGRMDEIRKARIAYGQNMNDAEMLSFLGLKSRPPFIQKKILRRLRFESPRFTESLQLQFYDFLIAMQKNFRSQVPLAKQSLIFQEAALRFFFNPRLSTASGQRASP